MNKTPIFKEGNFYMNKDSKLIVLCTENMYTHGKGWKGVVVLSSTIAWKMGEPNRSWRSDPEWWTDLGSNEENIINKEDI